MSEALKALYAGDHQRAEELLPADDELSVFEAAAFGREEQLQALLRADASQATALSSDGFTALHLAVFAEQAGTAQLLIEHGADVNALATSPIASVAPLGTAAFVRSLALARLLLDAGAEVNGRGEEGFTALHSAAQSGNEELVRLLLERGADPTLATTRGKRAADFAESDELRNLLAR